MKQYRDLLIRAGILLAGIIIIFSCISRLFLAGSDTLSEYAQKNPQLAYNESQEAVPTSTPASTAAPSPEPTPTENPQALVMKQFYYAPLTEKQKEFITGCSYPDTTEELVISYDDLHYVHILHYDFEGSVVEGELICNKAIAQDLIEIFYELYLNEYQLARVTLIENYNGDDTLSMTDNNTSCFNYRVVPDTEKLSQHAYGLAIDINPFYNPYITYEQDGSMKISPMGSEMYADRTAEFPYKIDENDLCYRLFKAHGFTWGGDWNYSKDYQHFQKAIP